ncbi:MAG: class II aldolase/adducin family protein [Clostridia bacterium]|nr:class II aldolase/adducin family protein [Clostridia bacterium]
MDILEAKNLVIEAGVKLVERGLIARTWGNVSCRIDDETFVITPSGKPYIGLTPDDIVEVKIEDLSYRGNVKPSSEKGVHAEVYKAHPEANFVIHTHQKYASVISDLSKGLCDIEGEAAQVIGSVVPIAAYGMPGTGKLRKGIIAALEKYNTKAIIMAHHGAVCFGSDFDDAFNVTAVLEDLCEKAILKLSKDFTGPVETLAEMCKAIPGKFGIDSEYVCTADTAYNSEIDREAGKITFTENGADETAAVLDLATGEAVEGKLPLEAELHRSVYQANEKYSNIIHNIDTETVAVSCLGKKMVPLLDDFAQIVGVKVKCTGYAAAPKALKKSNAVLIKNEGALCCGGNKGDAEAVDMIMSKNALTQLAATAIEKPRRISVLDSYIMRIVYTLKYSKQAEKKTEE